MAAEDMRKVPVCILGQAKGAQLWISKKETWGGGIMTHMQRMVDCGSAPKKKTVYRNGRRFMSYDKDFNHGCLGKQKFKNQNAAERYIEIHFPEDFEMMPYQCTSCNRYHIGHDKCRRPKNDKLAESIIRKMRKTITEG